jgi:sterol desaturase/sphingolipid hydroxylase (fatty acid hydroxylase superfamily)
VLEAGLKEICMPTVSRTRTRRAHNSLICRTRGVDMGTHMLSASWSVPIAMVVGYLVSSFLQVISHRWLGHQPVAGFIFRRHVFDHHRKYAPPRLVSATYSDTERSLTPYYALLVAAVIALVGHALPMPPLIGFSVTMMASYAAHAYVHEHYHLEKSWLSNWAWFCKRRDLHFVHHRKTGCNFAVIDFFWDRLLGTFVAVRSGPRAT